MGKIRINKDKQNPYKMYNKVDGCCTGSGSVGCGGSNSCCDVVASTTASLMVTARIVGFILKASFFDYYLVEFEIIYALNKTVKQNLFDSFFTYRAC